jgi:hypothetical protein
MLLLLYKNVFDIATLSASMNPVKQQKTTDILIVSSFLKATTDSQGNFVTDL